MSFRVASANGTFDSHSHTLGGLRRMSHHHSGLEASHRDGGGRGQLTPAGSRERTKDLHHHHRYPLRGAVVQAPGRQPNRGPGGSRALRRQTDPAADAFATGREAPVTVRRLRELASWNSIWKDRSAAAGGPVSWRFLPSDDRAPRAARRRAARSCVGSRADVMRCAECKCFSEDAAGWIAARQRSRRRPCAG